MSLQTRMMSLNRIGKLNNILRRASAPLSTSASDSVKMEDIVNLCKKKGFIFQSNEIYDPIAGFFDYGPLGVEMRNNIKKIWWRDMVQRRDDVVGIDCAIIGSHQVYKASGHIDGFSDPMVDCKSSKLRYRADQLFWGALKKIDGSGEVCYVCVQEQDEDEMQKTAYSQALKKAKKLGISGPFEPKIQLQDLTTAHPEIIPKIPSPATGEEGVLTLPREFNLMFSTKVGAVVDASTNTAYLRPETAQGIFTNFANVQRTSRKKIPFGIAQIGKAFRNEITPRNYIFRSREFEQMEIEYFIPPEDEIWPEYYHRWIKLSQDWLLSVGLRADLLSTTVHPANKLAHYAKACTDITFQYPFGVSELMGIAVRGNYDLTQHSEASGANLEYFDSANTSTTATSSTNSGLKYLPHVVEPSLGVDRLMLALLVSAYTVEVVPSSTSSTPTSTPTSETVTTSVAAASGETSAGNKKPTKKTAEKVDTRVVLKLHPSIAPIKVGVFPLVSNNPQLLALANDVYRKIRSRFTAEFDTSGAIGRRYRRADEIGIPYCVTIDFESLKNSEDNDSSSSSGKGIDSNRSSCSSAFSNENNNITVTIRERDSMKQERMTLTELSTFLTKHIDGDSIF